MKVAARELVRVCKVLVQPTTRQSLQLDTGTACNGHAVSCRPTTSFVSERSSYRGFVLFERSEAIGGRRCATTQQLGSAVSNMFSKFHIVHRSGGHKLLTFFARRTLVITWRLAITASRCRKCEHSHADRQFGLRLSAAGKKGVRPIITYLSY